MVARPKHELKKILGSSKAKAKRKMREYLHGGNWESVRQVLEHHPTNKTEGAIRFAFRTANGNERCFKRNQKHLFFTCDGSNWDSVSWVWCIDNIYKTKSKSIAPKRVPKVFCNAFRTTIHDTARLNFKNNDPYATMGKCVNCDVVDRDNVHIDHKDIPFRDILDSFLQDNSLDVERSIVKDGMCYRLNGDVRDKWIEYHDKRATFQSLCGQCNMRKG